MLISVGLMSGTSMDGIDAVAIRTDGETYIKKLASYSITYPDELKLLFKAMEFAYKTFITEEKKEVPRFAPDADSTITQEINAIGFELYLARYLSERLHIPKAELTHEIGRLRKFFHSDSEKEITLAEIIQRSTKLHTETARAIIKQIPSSNEPMVVGYHGQTVYHEPDRRITIQVAKYSDMSKELGLPVVGDFRKSDVLDGGQGAPLAPLYHQQLAVRDGLVPMVVINCGGISNVSLINGQEAAQLFGYDTGPGNVLLDRFVRKKTGGKELFDRDGNYAAQGMKNETALAALREHSCRIGDTNYYLRKPPKSLDANDLTLPEKVSSLSIEDGCATLAYFTAEMIVEGLLLHSSADDFKAYNTFALGGGGWENPTIRQYFEQIMAERLGIHPDKIPDKIKKVDELPGWKSSTLEAEIFAHFAVRNLNHLPTSVPSTTGTKKPQIGGTLFEPEASCSFTVVDPRPHLYNQLTAPNTPFWPLPPLPDSTTTGAPATLPSSAYLQGSSTSSTSGFSLATLTSGSVLLLMVILAFVWRQFSQPPQAPPETQQPEM